MTEEKSISRTGLIIGLILSAAFGALVAYLILRQPVISSLDIPIHSVAAIQPTPPLAVMPPPLAMPSVGMEIMPSGTGIGMGTRYNNKEKWKIIRNSGGDIDSIEVIRDANIDG